MVRLSVNISKTLRTVILTTILHLRNSHALSVDERVKQRISDRYIKRLLRSEKLAEMGEIVVRHQSQMHKEKRDLSSSIDDLSPDFAPPEGSRPAINYEIQGGKCYDPLRISLATHHLMSLVSTSPGTNAQINALVNEILPSVTSVWSEALYVVPVVGNLFHNQTTCGGAVVPESFKTEGVPDSDLILYILGLFTGEGGCTGSTLAYAGPCEYDQFMRPIAGRVVICLDKIQVDENNNIPPEEIDFQAKVLTHEVGHVLGMSSGMMKYYKNEQNGLEWGSTFVTNVSCVDGSVRDIEIPNILKQRTTPTGDTFFEVVSPTVVQVARNHFDCQTMSGARLENQPLTPTCFGYHWDEVC